MTDEERGFFIESITEPWVTQATLNARHPSCEWASSREYTNLYEILSNRRDYLCLYGLADAFDWDRAPQDRMQWVCIRNDYAI